MPDHTDATHSHTGQWHPGYGPGSAAPRPDAPATYPTAGYAPVGPPEVGYPATEHQAAGYPPPGYLAPGYPPAGYPGYQPHPGRQVKPATNGLATGSMVAGIVGLAAVPVIAPLVAIVLGHMAQAQIRKTGEAGGGMALAGLVTGYLGVVMATMGIAIVMWLSSDSAGNWIATVLRDTFGS